MKKSQFTEQQIAFALQQAEAGTTAGGVCRKPHTVSWTRKNQTDGRVNLGLIAQGVEPLLPELVTRNSDENDYMALNYTGLIPVLAKALQEQQSALEQMDAEISASQSQNSALEGRLSILEHAVARLADFELSRQRGQDRRAEGHLECHPTSSLASRPMRRPDPRAADQIAGK